MPFKSEAQRRKFYAMAERGEMSKEKVREYEKETKGDIPEKVKQTKAHKEELLQRARERSKNREVTTNSKAKAKMAKGKARKVVRKSEG